MEFSTNRIQTHDFDEFLAWEHVVGIESEQTQLSRGRARMSAAFGTFDDLVVWRHQSSERMLCEYSIPDDMIELCVCRHPAPSLWCDQEFSETSLVVHCDRQRYRAIIPPQGLSYGCLIPIESAFHWGLISEQQHSLAATRQRAVVPAADSVVDSLIARLDSLLDSTVAQGAANQPIHKHDALLSAWQHTMDQCLAPYHTTKTSDPNKEQALVESALDMIARHPDEAFTVAQISDELQVTRRTLERGFRRLLGVSPYQFMLTRRLHLARRILKRGHESVLTTCSQTGFENSSRFAMLYSRHFGELPSQTKTAD